MDYKYQGELFKMEYKVLVGASTHMLSTAVEKYVASGWKLVGGASASLGCGTNAMFTQAVIKED